MITVIVTLHNQERSIISALQSVVAQTAQQWECVVIDNASTDASEFQVRSYLFDRRMRYCRLEQHVSTQEARRIALAHTTGEWVVFLDGADYLESNALQALYLAVKKYGTKCGVANYAVMRNGEPHPHNYLQGQKLSAERIRNGEVSVVTGNSIFHRSIAGTPEVWPEQDYAYTEHLILISGDAAEPLVTVEKKKSLIERITGLFKKTKEE